MIGPGVIIAERFRLERPLGKGGMGTVWRAHHQALDIPCAVKLIRAGADEMFDLRARFAREAKAAAALRSPHVVTILDHGEWEGTPYIAMELLEGEDLARRLKREKRLSAEEIVSIVTQVARALSKAHGVGLVHRDMKPANIFLAKDDEREITKVLDFGIAKTNTLSVGDASTKTGSLLGTPFYMSPEQAQGTRQIDHLADLWSLAVVVFQALVGRLPFQSTALGDLLMQIMTHPLPVPTECAEDVPPAFDAWWARAASRDATARFQTARELAEALTIALDAEPAAASVSLGRQRADGATASSPPPVPSARPSSGGAAARVVSSPPTPMPQSSSPSSPPATPMPQSDGAARGSTMALSGAVPIPISIRPPVARSARGWIALVALALLGGAAVLAFAWSGGRPAAPASNAAANSETPPAAPPSVAAKPSPSPSVAPVPETPPAAAAQASASVTATAAASAGSSAAAAGRAPARRSPPPARAPKPANEPQPPPGTDYGI
jgi:serine/threonine protein kinase